MVGGGTLILREYSTALILRTRSHPCIWCLDGNAHDRHRSNASWSPAGLRRRPVPTCPRWQASWVSSRAAARRPYACGRMTILMAHRSRLMARPYYRNMRAMVLSAQASIDDSPLRLEHVPRPEPAPGEILVQVEACGVCRTDLHVVEGHLPPETMPVIPGHQVVGRVRGRGPGATRFVLGERAGIAWLRSTDGTCRYCRRGQENLCPHARFTGYMADGGYAEYAVVRQDFAYHIPPDIAPLHAAPLLCAGIIGYRALKRTEVRPGERLGIYGFGASAHVAIQVALHWGCTVYVATR